VKFEVAVELTCFRSVRVDEAELLFCLADRLRRVLLDAERVDASARVELLLPGDVSSDDVFFELDNFGCKRVQIFFTVRLDFGKSEEEMCSQPPSADT
jgi:hypothetical protein